MSVEVLLRLGALLPIIHAGLYTLTVPANSIRFVNRIMAQAHQIESQTILGDLFAEPKPFVDSSRNRTYWRIAGLATLAAGLLRLYAL